MASGYRIKKHNSIHWPESHVSGPQGKEGLEWQGDQTIAVKDAKHNYNCPPALLIILKPGAV